MTHHVLLTEPSFLFSETDHESTEPKEEEDDGKAAASVETEDTHLNGGEGGLLAVAGGIFKFGKRCIGGRKGSAGENGRSTTEYCTAGGLNVRHSLREKAKYIPLRLSMDERRYLRLLESILSVSDYTGEVDRSFKNSSKRMHRVLKQACVVFDHNTRIVVLVVASAGAFLLCEPHIFLFSLTAPLSVIFNSHFLFYLKH